MAIALGKTGNPKPWLLGFAALLCAQLCWGQQAAIWDLGESATQARIREDVDSLASPRLKGRPTGSAEERLAASYIAQAFKSAGLQVRMQPFKVEATESPGPKSRNILAFLDRHADSTIVVTAHYDHLGLGSGKSLEIIRQGIHPGADDNASGVAILLELSRRLGMQPSQHYNYLFVATSAHEIGLWGAKSLLTQKRFTKLKINRLLNLDMVGRMDPKSKTIRLSYCELTPEITDIEALGKKFGLYVLRDDNHETQNDFSVFCGAHLPCYSLTTGIHDDYHRISDTPDKINFEGMWRILQLCESFLQQ